MQGSRLISELEKRKPNGNGRPKSQDCYTCRLQAKPGQSFSCDDCSKLGAIGKKCKHPKSKRWRDPETKKLYCKSCSAELPSDAPLIAVTSEKFNRGPENHAVFRKNLGAGSKQNNAKRGPQPHHLEAVTRGVYGKRNKSILPSDIITKTCPSCGKQMPVPVFQGAVFCENHDCEVELGHYSLLWQPIVPHREACSVCGTVIYEPKRGYFNFEELLAARKKHYSKSPSCEPNGNRVPREPNKALWLWSDLRRIELLDPVEDDPAVKLAREIFSQELNGRLGDEAADRVGAVYMKSAKQLIANQRRELRALLPNVLDSILVTLEPNNT